MGDIDDQVRDSLRELVDAVVVVTPPPPDPPAHGDEEAGSPRTRIAVLASAMVLVGVMSVAAVALWPDDADVPDQLASTPSATTSATTDDDRELDEATPSVRDDDAAVDDGAVEAAPRFQMLADPVMSASGAILQRGGVLTVDVDSAQIDSAATTVQRLAEDGGLGRVVIVHIGTDGPLDVVSVDRLFDELAGVSHVVAVTNHGEQPWTAANNEVIAALDRYSNVVVFDWAGRAPGCSGDCFADDGVALADDGQWFFATELAAFVGFDLPERIMPRDDVVFVGVGDDGNAYRIDADTMQPELIFEGPADGPHRVIRAVVSTAESAAVVAMCCEPLTGEVFRIDLSVAGAAPERVGRARAVALSPDGDSLAVAQPDTVVAGDLGMGGGLFIAIPPDAGVVYDLDWFISPNIDTQPSPFPEWAGQLVALARTPEGISLITMTDLAYTATADHSTIVNADPDADVTLAGITDDGHVLIHDRGRPDELASYDPVTLAVSSTVTLPADARSAWSEGGRLAWIDESGQLRIDDTAIAGTYRAIVGS